MDRSKAPELGSTIAVYQDWWKKHCRYFEASTRI